MRIIYALPTSGGGIPHYLAQLANSVAKYAEVIVLKPEKTTGDDIFSKDIRIVNAFKPLRLAFVDMYSMRRSLRMLSPSNLTKIFSFRNIDVVSRLNPDIVHFIDLPPQIRIFAGKLGKYPKIATFNGVASRNVEIRFDNPCMFFFSIIMSVWNSLSYPFVSTEFERLIVHTQIHRKALIRNGIQSERIVVIPQGVFSFFAEMLNSERREEKNTILFFGNIVWSKALDVLVDAVPIAAKEIHDIKLIIAGDGVIPKQSLEIIEKHKANFEIHNYFIPNEVVGEFFSRACLVVIPNRRQEGHSASLTVAYSFGKPVVTTSVGEFPVLVKDAGCGLVVPPENPGALAEAITDLLKSEELRTEMGTNAFRKAQELSWDNIAEKHIEVYRNVLDERRKARG